MEKDNHIVMIIERFTHDIASEVEFEYLKGHLRAIFPRIVLQKAEGKERCSYDIMVNICVALRSRSWSDFLKFLDAIRQDYPHVFDAINEYYRQITGHNLPNYEIPSPHLQNAPIPPENAPISSQKAPSLSQSASMPQSNANPLPQNAPAQTAPIPSYNPSVPPQNVPIPSQNAPIPSQNAPIPSQNALIPSQNASSPAQYYPIPPLGASVSLQNVPLISQQEEFLELTDVNLRWDLEMCDPKEIEISESRQGSSYNASFLTESNITSRHNDVSLGPAVTYPSSQISNHANPLFAGSSTQMPSDLSEGNQSPVGSSAMEVSSTGTNTPASGGIDVPREATEYRREASSQLRKYHKAIIKDPKSVYRMESSPRGHCLIINNENFENFPYREGSHKDLGNLTWMFRFLNFRVFPFQNRTAEEMKAHLEEFAQSPDLNQLSSLAVVILSHGGPNDSIYGQDGAVANNCPVPGTFITRLELQRIFNTTNCPSMKGKPKLFIIQACRGEDEDNHVRSDNKSLGVNKSSYCGDGGLPDANAEECETESDHPSPELHRAETADMCFLHSSSLGYMAYRSRSEGSPFVQLFTKNVIKHAHEKSLDVIVMKIQKTFSTTPIGSTKMTMPDYNTLLTRKWYFNPPSE
ncbi:hypothetical protein BsWGS_26545 [Bradybaena similaris]